MRYMPRRNDRDMERAKASRGPETYLYEYQEWWKDILSGTLGPLLISGLILSIIIAGILAVNDIGYHRNGDVCLGNLCIVGVGWFAVLIGGIIVSLFSDDEN